MTAVERTCGAAALTICTTVLLSVIALGWQSAGVVMAAAVLLITLALIAGI